MTSNNHTTYSQLIQPITSEENLPLLSPEQPYQQNIFKRLSGINIIPRQLCLPSKSAVLILFWTAVVSAIYKTVEETALYVLADISHNGHRSKDSHGIIYAYLAFVMIHLLYPFAGFLADVHCGRYKMVIISLVLLLCGNGLLCVLSILIFTGVVKEHLYSIQNAQYYFFTLGAGLLFLITGLSSYQANIVQLGLDQLLDAPSEYLGLFVHWLEVFTEIGFFIPRPIFVLFEDCSEYTATYKTALSLPFVFFFGVLLLLLFGCWKRYWFYTESGKINPYKMVLKVLNFTRKHKYPLNRSAFTYGGDEDPSRIDFAKSKYGGPFTTEQVEDVKTFFKIIAMLLAIGPIFFLEIPLGPLFDEFAHHIGRDISQAQECSSIWVTMFCNTSVLRSLAAITAFPIYIWVIYCVLRRCIPRTLVRIWIGELLFLIGIATLFFVDLAGHAEYYSRNNKSAGCMFVRNDSNHSFHLELPWSLNILPAFLIEVAVGLTITTTFEFISAQSPHFMKGFLIGIFYVIRGTFKFLGTISMLPFSLSIIWNGDYINTHMPPITNCGFGYFLLNFVVGFVSFLLFSVAAKRYKCRERDDPPFKQIIVERVWADALLRN